MEERQRRYFVVKVIDMSALRRCIDTGVWACRDRENPPHPRAFLQEAVNNGQVVLLYSVNNYHGWHGYAEMVSTPGSDQPIKIESETFKTDSGISNCPDESCAKDDSSDMSRSSYEQTISEKGWHYFNVKWKCIFLEEFGESACLPFKSTEQFSLSDQCSLNKSRNWQEVSQITGAQVCKLIDREFNRLCLLREEKIKKEEEKQSPAFFSTVDDNAVEQNWRKIVEKVESELGPVLLACPFGSQRYNLSTADSDTDMFIVYQASTQDMLGFHPPKQTIKSGDSDTSDYTIHEVFRFCELLVSGDARCVETLFLHPATIIQTSLAIENIKESRKLFLNRECLMKYARDAQGTRGTKLLQKWCNDNKDVEELPQKIRKLVYVIIRLLQNAVNIVNGEDLKVFRADDSLEKQTLMSIRAGPLSVTDAWATIQRLEAQLETGKELVAEKGEEVEKFVKSWLLELRYSNMLTDQPQHNATGLEA